jgi:hypothetical protein
VRHMHILKDAGVVGDMEQLGGEDMAIALK